MASTKSTKSTGTVATRKAGVVVKSMPTGVTLQDVTEEFGTSDSTELERLRIITAFRAAGFSQRQAIASAAKANRGIAPRGFTNGTVGRYWVVASATTRDDLPKLTEVQGIRAALAVIALSNVASAADVAAAVDLAVKGSKTGAAFTSAIVASAAKAGKDNYRSLTAPAPQSAPRGARGQGGTGKKKSDAPEIEPEIEPTVKGGAHKSGTRETLATIGLTDLLAEVQRRVSVKGYTVTSIDLPVLESITSAVERAVTAGRVVSVPTA
jgi:hypothetical protein